MASSTDHPRNAGQPSGSLGGLVMVALAIAAGSVLLQPRGPATPTKRGSGGVPNPEHAPEIPAATHELAKKPQDLLQRLQALRAEGSQRANRERVGLLREIAGTAEGQALLFDLAVGEVIQSRFRPDELERLTAINVLWLKPDARQKLEERAATGDDGLLSKKVAALRAGKAGKAGD